MLHFCVEMCALQFVAALVCVFCVGHPLGTKQAVCAPSVAEMYTSYNRRLQSSIGAAFLIVPHVQWAFLSFFLSFLSVSVPLHNPTDRVSDQKPGKLAAGVPSLFRSCHPADWIWVFVGISCTFVRAALLCHLIRGFERKSLQKGNSAWDSPQTDNIWDKRGRAGGKGLWVFPIFQLTWSPKNNRTIWLAQDLLALHERGSTSYRYCGNSSQQWIQGVFGKSYANPTFYTTDL